MQIRKGKSYENNRRTVQGDQGIYEKLNDEQKEKAKACKTMKELMEFAGEWGIEIPDELADSVACGRVRHIFL